jgi:hypothetical protein
MKPSASTAGAGAADKARERRNACSADRISSERVENSPDETNESTSWSSLRLHRSAMRASSDASREGSAARERADFPSGALSNTAKNSQVNFCYLNERTFLRKQKLRGLVRLILDVSNRHVSLSNGADRYTALSITRPRFGLLIRLSWFEEARRRGPRDLGPRWHAFVASYPTIRAGIGKRVPGSISGGPGHRRGPAGARRSPACGSVALCALMCITSNDEVKIDTCRVMRLIVLSTRCSP